MLCGGAFLMGLSWLTRESFHWPPQPLAAAAWIYLVTFGSLVAFSAYMVLLARARPAVAASYGFVNPLIALLLGLTWGGESISVHEWIAVGVIVPGVAILLLARK
jgi:drug/metabolite transporter (DMT)-like permease